METTPATTPADNAVEQKQNTPAPSQPKLSEEGKHVASILNMVQDNPAMASDPEVKKILDSFSEFKSKGAAQKKNEDDGAAQSTQAKPAAKKDEDKIDLEADNDNGDPDDDEEDVDNKAKSVFFSGSKGGAKNKTEFKTLEDIMGYVKQKYSIDEPTKFFDTVDKLRNSNQELKKKATTATEYDRLFENMPDELYGLIETWGSGKDWTEEAKKLNGRLDYNKDFDAFNKYDILNRYFPNKFEKEELSGDYKDLDPSIQRAFDVAKEKYNLEKEQFQSKRASYDKAAKDKHDAYRASVESSVEKLKQSLPEFSKRHLSSIERKLLSGDINSLFLDAKGNPLPDAAEKIALALYGKQEIDRMRNISEQSQEDLHNTVSRKSDTPRTQRSQQVSATDDKFMESVKGLVPKSHY